MRGAFGLLLLALLGCQTERSSSARLAEGTWSAIDGEVRRFRETRSLPGISVAVVRGGDVIFEEGYGWADVDARTPVTPRTMFPIGSVEKQFTAATVMRLVEEGRISLDDPITRHLPRLDTGGQVVTIRDMLHQVSGLQDLGTLAAMRRRTATPAPRPGPWGPVPDLDVGEGFDSTADIAPFQGQPLHFAPRERFAYCQPNYDLLCYVIAALTGRTYYEAIGDVAAKAKLETFHAAWTPRPPEDDPAVAHGYHPDGTGLEEVWEPNLGSAWTTAADLARWGWALSHGRVVSPASFAEMTSPAVLGDGRRWPYGFGLGLETLGGKRRLVHSGDVLGFYAGLVSYPDDDLAIAFLTNVDEGWFLEGLEPRIARLLLDLPAPEVRDLPIPAPERARYLGTYDAGPLWLDVVPDGAGLALVLREPDYIEAGETVFRDKLRSQGAGEFIANGTPDWLRVSFTPGPDPAAEMVVVWDGAPYQAVRRGD